MPVRADESVKKMFSMPSSLRTFSGASAPSGRVLSIGSDVVIRKDYAVSYYSKSERRQTEAQALFKPSNQSLSFAGHVMEITQGPVPLNMDPMETPAQKELAIKEYRRVELIGHGKGLFYSEAENFGLHISKVSPDAALFVKASENGAQLKFSSSFKYFPFD
jgi:hypothetical protein